MNRSLGPPALFRALNLKWLVGVRLVLLAASVWAVWWLDAVWYTVTPGRWEGGFLVLISYPDTTLWEASPFVASTIWFSAISIGALALAGRLSTLSRLAVVAGAVCTGLIAYQAISPPSPNWARGIAGVEVDPGKSTWVGLAGWYAITWVGLYGRRVARIDDSPGIVRWQVVFSERFGRELGAILAFALGAVIAAGTGRMVFGDAFVLDEWLEMAVMATALGYFAGLVFCARAFLDRDRLHDLPGSVLVTSIALLGWLVAFPFDQIPPFG